MMGRNPWFDQECCLRPAATEWEHVRDFMPTPAGVRTASAQRAVVRPRPFQSHWQNERLKIRDSACCPLFDVAVRLIAHTLAESDCQLGRNSSASGRRRLVRSYGAIQRPPAQAAQIYKGGVGYLG